MSDLILRFSGEAEANKQDRTLSGLILPFGAVGNTSIGPVTFDKGSVAIPEKVARIKLLSQHDSNQPLGYATEIREEADGLYGTFQLGEGPLADEALAMSADGRRDGFSVGVRLDDAAKEALWNWDGGDPIKGSGELFETSHVTFPAFEDARVAESLAAGADENTILVATVAASNGKGVTMSDNTNATAAEVTAEAQTVAAATPNPVQVEQVTAQVTSEPAIYTFNGQGPSFVRDAFNARFSNDFEAAQRLHKFNESLKAQNARQVGVLTAAVEDRTSLDVPFPAEGYRPTLIEAIDLGRPLVSRIGTNPLTDATPFRLPVEGDFTGVGDHTEGTAHATEGDMTMTDVTVTPGAVSGAYRISRELVDASNPAVDALALKAMLRNYRSVTEGKVVTALAAADATATVNINTVLELRSEINSYWDLINESPTGVASSTTYYATLLADVDGSGRPHLAYNPQNNVGGIASAGYTGATVDGVEVFKASGVSANDAYLFHKDFMFVGESAVQTFRFDEVEGPGIIKLALYAYFVAKSLKDSSVVKITSAATD